jgi:Fur family transcriptional regulator, ferric uptake regulator
MAAEKSKHLAAEARSLSGRNAQAATGGEKSHFAPIFPAVAAAAVRKSEDKLESFPTRFASAISTAQTPSVNAADPIDALLSAHGLRRTAAARRVLGWLLAHADTSYTHAQLQVALMGNDTEPSAAALDRVTLYRLIDRLTQVGLLLCRVDASRVRRYQAMPSSVHAIPHFECQTCHRDSPLSGALQAQADDLERAAQTALAALKALGYQGMSLDVAVRGVCLDCAVEASA